MGVIYTTTLLRKRRGFAARKDFIPTVQQQGCVLQAPEAQQAQHTRPAAGAAKCQTPFSSPQGSTGTYWSSRGATRCELESSGELWTSNRHEGTSHHWFSSAEHNWENDGPLTHHCSLPIRV